MRRGGEPGQTVRFTAWELFSSALWEWEELLWEEEMALWGPGGLPCDNTLLVDPGPSPELGPGLCCKGEGRRLRLLEGGEYCMWDG